ncbi:MAG TPA: transporter substrate-binding domain-containing protein, partial [Polyangiaceae bacterium]
MALGAAQRFAVLVWFALDLACASSAPPSPAPLPLAASAASSSPAPQRAHAKLRVGTSGDYAPFSTLDQDGKPRGFDAEIAAALAQDLGFDLEWVGFRWPTLQTQLQNSEFDLAMSGVTWQPTRAVTGYLTRAVARGGP